MARRVDREGYKQVQRSLGDMQSQIARLNQDLSFYRGLVQPDSLIHVKVQQMQIVPQAPPGQFQLEVRADADRQAGQGGDRAARRSPSTACRRASRMSLSFAQVSPNRRVSLAYSFRVLSGLRRDRRSCRRASNPRASEWRFTAAGMRTQFPAGLRLEGAGHVGRNRGQRQQRRQRETRMFKRKPNKTATIDTLIGAEDAHQRRCRIRRRLPSRRHINGNVACESVAERFLSVSEHGCIEGSVVVPNCCPERHGQGRHRGQRPGRTGRQGAGSRQCALHGH